MNSTFLSPSGNYKLTIEYYKKLNEGIVNRISDNKEIIVISRNESDFPFTFFNKNGKEWLWCGKDRLEQTFINLNDEKIYKKDASFFWKNLIISPLGDILVINGCVWGGSDEYDFYDFSNPEEDMTPIKKFIKNDSKEYISVYEKNLYNKTSEQSYYIDTIDSKLKWIDNYTLDVVTYKKILKEGYTYDYTKYPYDTKEKSNQIISRHYIINFDLSSKKALIEDVTIRPYKIIDWINEKDEEE